MNGPLYVGPADAAASRAMPHTRVDAVLVIDDNEDVLTAIRLLLRGHVETVHTATDPDALPTLLRETRYDCVLLDMNFHRDASSGREGLRWLEHARTIDPAVAVVMITGYGDVDLAVRAMQYGAADFVTKPWSNERLLAAVEAAARLRRSRGGASEGRPPSRDGLDRGRGGRGALPGLVGESQATRAVFETVWRAPADHAIDVGADSGEAVLDVTAPAVRRALSQHGGDVTRAAGEFGLSREALYRWVREHGL